MEKSHSGLRIGRAGHRRQASEEKYDYFVKLILTGDACVGKSNVLVRYVKQTFEYTTPTIGVEFDARVHNLKNGKRAKVQMWDTSGSERYRSITIGHYRCALGAVIVYDVTSEESFKNLDYWLKQVRENADENCLILVLPNKVDLLSERPEKRQVEKK